MSLWRGDTLRAQKTLESMDEKEGADWLYRQFYRLDRILIRFLRSLAVPGPLPALLGLKLGEHFLLVGPPAVVHAVVSGAVVVSQVQSGAPLWRRSMISELTPCFSITA